MRLIDIVLVVVTVACVLTASSAASEHVGNAPAAWSAADAPSTIHEPARSVPSNRPPAVATTTSADGRSAPHLVEVYPNTVTEQNVGEYVVVAFPEPTNLSGWTLTDGKTTAYLPNETVSGRVAFSTDPVVTELLTPYPVIGLDDRFALAVSGETIELRNRDVVVDSTTYERAPRARAWTRTDDGWRWRSAGATGFEPVERPATTVTAFVLPDDPDLPVAVLREADDRILIAGYTFSSDRTADALLEAHRRGVHVHVIVDGSPVGGVSRGQAAVLDRLVDAGVPVTVVGGERGRYRFHHAKYAVVDDRSIVLTENWKPSGTGGRSSRGWGVVVEGDAVASDLEAVFMADTGWRDSTSWQRYRQDRSFVDETAANATYPSYFESRTISVDSVRVLTAPDNAEHEILSVLDAAEESILIKQVRISGRSLPFVEATIDAAGRGVRVQILLDRTWYVERENRAFARDMEELAATEGLPIEVRLAEPTSRFEKVHAKGLVVDDRIVVLGSINWNENSIRNNREVAVVLQGDEVGAYYASVFRADWRGGRWYLPIEFGAGVGVATGVAVLIARRTVTFAP